MYFIEIQKNENYGRPEKKSYEDYKLAKLEFEYQIQNFGTEVMTINLVTFDRNKKRIVLDKFDNEYFVYYNPFLS